MYRIELTYQTGDSLSSNEVSSLLDLSWGIELIALKNLKAIESHYNMYMEVNESLSNWRTGLEDTQSVFEKYENERWFYGKEKKWFIDFKSNGKYVIMAATDKNLDKYKHYPSKWLYSSECAAYMFLETDNGEYMQQRNEWCGYFESLYGAEIINDAPENKISFR